jgi:hypothetical protein
VGAQAVANAGTTGTFDIAGASLDDWRKVNSVNYDGVFYLARVVGPCVVFFRSLLLLIILFSFQNLQETGIRQLHRDGFKCVMLLASVIYSADVSCC